MAGAQGAKRHSTAIGRPTRYNEALAREICNRLANGESLRAICRDEKMPDRSTVIEWANDPKHPFSDQYARAREVAYLEMADELLEIADDSTVDYMTRKRGDEEIEVVNSDHITRSRLRVDTRKWMLSKMLPKVYGDKIVHQGDDDQPVKHAHTVKIVVVDPPGATEGSS